MTNTQQKQLGTTLWGIADTLRGTMNADDFRDYMLSFLFLRYLSVNYEEAAKKELGVDYIECEKEIKNIYSIGNQEETISVLQEKTVSYFSKQALAEDTKDMMISDHLALLESKKLMPLVVWYSNNLDHIATFEKQMRRKVHFVIKPNYLWSNIYELARTQNKSLLRTLQAAFKFIENESFDSTFRGLFSEVNLDSDKLGKTYELRNTTLCTIINKIAEGLSEFPNNSDILGDAYEYLIGQFAAGSGKKAGEFYTPPADFNHSIPYCYTG